MLKRTKECEEVKFPMQPIRDGFFVENRIVVALLAAGPLDMNKLAQMSFTRAERVQFAQLIGYNLAGFEELSYVSEEEYDLAITGSRNSEVGA